MPWLALALYLLYLGLAFGWRTWLMLTRAGTSGFHGISGTPAQAQWWGGVLFAVALVAGLVAPVLQLAGATPPLAALDTTGIAVIGTGIAVAGIAGTLVAQAAMGDTWRIGIDEQERTALVTRGVFARVRNPVFTAMLAVAIGLALITPNVVALAGTAALLLAIELQVRYAEEPYLRRAHGPAYVDYAATSGRFFPGIGRLG
ncbi:MAG: isoprenylcysteine carboxylmethyltransferase family protein [Solirubrobacteraceae bacterium]|nr:isoprenylcysteine carboxylmethyltransferase family protein [Solirubrobacteraceae bacterium]